MKTDLDDIKFLHEMWCNGGRVAKSAQVVKSRANELSRGDVYLGRYLEVPMPLHVRSLSQLLSFIGQLQVQPTQGPRRQQWKLATLSNQASQNGSLVPTVRTKSLNACRAVPASLEKSIDCSGSSKAPFPRQFPPWPTSAVPKDTWNPSSSSSRNRQIDDQNDPENCNDPENTSTSTGTYHPIALLPMTEPPASSISVFCADLDTWESNWIEWHEWHSDMRKKASL